MGRKSCRKYRKMGRWAVGKVDGVANTFPWRFKEAFT